MTRTSASDNVQPPRRPAQWPLGWRHTPYVRAYLGADEVEVTTCCACLSNLVVDVGHIHVEGGPPGKYVVVYRRDEQGQLRIVVDGACGADALPPA